MLLVLRLLLIWGTFRLNAPARENIVALRLLRFALLLACGQILQYNNTNNKPSVVHICIYVWKRGDIATKQQARWQRWWWWHRPTARQHAKLSNSQKSQCCATSMMQTNMCIRTQTHTHIHMYKMWTCLH